MCIFSFSFSVSAAPLYYGFLGNGISPDDYDYETQSYTNLTEIYEDLDKSQYFINPIPSIHDPSTLPVNGDLTRKKL